MTAWWFEWFLYGMGIFTGCIATLLVESILIKRRIRRREQVK